MLQYVNIRDHEVFRCFESFRFGMRTSTRTTPRASVVVVSANFLVLRSFVYWSQDAILQSIDLGYIVGFQKATSVFQ